MKDQEIINAIHNHTTGQIHMSTVGQIVFVADKLEKNKKTNVENNKLRKQLFTQTPFEQIFTKTLNNVYSKLLDENKQPDATMKAAWQHYCQKKT
ncbi:MAG: hypothetical protein QJQ54_03295 [Mollicutes bacterium]|nr:MAG: hypothetical protein QJQ54_03295 [Mollicutes bacterium]